MRGRPTPAITDLVSSTSHPLGTIGTRLRATVIRNGDRGVRETLRGGGGSFWDGGEEWKGQKVLYYPTLYCLSLCYRSPVLSFTLLSVLDVILPQYYHLLYFPSLNIALPKLALLLI